MAHGTHVMWSYKLVEVSHAHLNYDEVHSSYIDAYSFGRRLNPLNGLKFLSINLQTVVSKPMRFRIAANQRWD